MPNATKKFSSKRLTDRHSKPSSSIVDALIEGERSGTSKKKIKDIIASAKKNLKNG